MKTKTVFYNQNGAPLYEADGILPIIEGGMGVEVRDETGHCETFLVRGFSLTIFPKKRGPTEGIPTIEIAELRVAIGPLK